MALRAEFKRISVDAARELLGAGGVEILDMRDAKSFQQAHIDGARHVNDANLGDMLMSVAKDRPVLICCYHGNASQVYAQTFVDFGFSDVYSIDGGFEAWRKSAAGGQ